MSEKQRAYLAIVFAYIILGVSFVVVKVVLEYSTPLTILANRFLIAFLFILPYHLIVRKRVHITKSIVLRVLPIALIYPVAYFIFQIIALNYATSSEMAIIQASSPVMVVILATIILKEAVSIRQLIFIFISISGVFFILFSQGSTISAMHFFGLILCILTIFTIALQNVLVRKYKSEYTTYQFSYISLMIGFIVYSIFAMGYSLYKNDFEQMILGFKSPIYIGGILHLAILSSIVSPFCINYAFSRIEASKLGVFSNIAVITAIISASVVLNETIQWQHIVGGLMIVVGVIGCNYNTKQ